ncbi:hypothetical protein FISHEDRAFT_70056 [Fistulina hepatica ATCC 64428]|uniref:Uncharacterized protein n=1 Tax=Fistulina hepatica ATCC 64428 TaxID=1128425 RepID=A0A0D7ALB7_9AGAR|nr:hypothetical protein FISHEDRAFT_70056 [Fistulina hepatica ATCC 64428]
MPSLHESAVASAAPHDSPSAFGSPLPTPDDSNADPDYEEPDRKGKHHAKKSVTPLFFPSSPHTSSLEFELPDTASATRTPPLKLQLHPWAPVAVPLPAAGQATTPVDVPAHEPSQVAGPPHLIICLPAQAAAPAAQLTPAPAPIAMMSSDLPSHWIHREGYPATLPECCIVPLCEMSPVHPLLPSVRLTSSLLNDPIHYNPEFVDVVEHELAEEDWQ